MRSVSSLGRVAGIVSFAALGALAFAAPAAAADFNTDYAPPPAAYGPPPAPAYAPAPVYAAPVVVAPSPYYRPYPYSGWRGYWGPRYAGWYGRPWGWRRW